MNEEEGIEKKKSPENGASTEKDDQNSDPTTTDEEELFDEDEKELFARLMKKLENADELGKELDSDLGDFSERVENVVDSVDRIEHLEKSSLDSLAYKVEIPSDRKEDPLADTEKNKPFTPVTTGKRETGKKIDQETSNDENVRLSDDTALDGGQVMIPTESPYSDIRSGTYAIDIEDVITDIYGNNVDLVLEKMMKLINIKINKNEIESGKMLFNIAVNIGADSEFFREHFIGLADKLGMDLPKTEILKRVEEAEKKEMGIEPDEETTVLEPELAGEISILQKKASSAIQHLDRLIESSKLPQEDFNKVKGSYLRATILFRDKMFHKAYNTALSALELIKNQVQDTIDDQIQSNLFKTKEMLEEFSKDTGKSEPEKVLELKTTFDRAMKAYLTNEYERADLLAKRVMSTIRDFTEPEGEPLRERIEQYKKELRKLQELKIHGSNVEDLMQTIKKAGDLVDRRDTENAQKLLDMIIASIEKIRKKTNIYASAKEMEIKLSNKVERLKSSGYELDLIEKKLTYLHNYLRDERYQDVLKLGGQIETDIGSLERIKNEAEIKRIMDGLEENIIKADDLDDPAYYKNEYSKVKAAYQNNEMDIVKDLGSKLLEEMRTKRKTRIVDRGRRLARAVIGSKILLMKLRSLNVETNALEREIRKAKNLLKEDFNIEGLRSLDRINEEMKKKYKKEVSFLKKYLNIYRDSLEVLMDRHREEAVMYYVRSRHVPLIRKMSELGKYIKALDSYKNIETQFADLTLPEKKKSSIESNLTEVKFEIYKRKEEGKDISEPLTLYTLAQKRFGEGKVVPTEYLVEVSKRFCETFMPL